jgi:hypothetical protein
MKPLSPVDWQSRIPQVRERQRQVVLLRRFCALQIMLDCVERVCLYWRDIRSCLEYEARQPGNGNATVPSLSKGLEDVTSVNTGVNRKVFHGNLRTAA